MTISEHLHFSVLSAPVAALDRRALSQAWYSALFGEKARHAPAPPQMPIGSAQPTPAAHPPMIEQSALARSFPPEVTAARHAVNARLRGGQIERRANRCALARKIERAFLRPGSRVRKATFTVEGTNARVHVVLQTAGMQTRLIAICARGEHARVAQALMQARFALAARGITLDTKLREAVS